MMLFVISRPHESLINYEWSHCCSKAFVDVAKHERSCSLLLDLMWKPLSSHGSFTNNPWSHRCLGTLRKPQNVITIVASYCGNLSFILNVFHMLIGLKMRNFTVLIDMEYYFNLWSKQFGVSNMMSRLSPLIRYILSYYYFT